MNDLIESLKQTPLFTSLDSAELASVIEQAVPRRYSASDRIIAEDVPGDQVYILLKGRVEIAKTLDSIGRQVIHLCGPGDSFGEMSVLEEKPRSAEAIALEPTEVLVLRREQFEALIRRFPSVAMNLLRTISRRLREMNEKLVAALERRTHRLEEENDRLVDEISRAYPRDLSSRSPSMQNVLTTARKASATPVTVLLLGESGTGKEVLARAIHQWSDRRKSPFVAVNCAALPSTLLESELFGHEKGAFTGATQMRKGRFELADGGTLSLDEIGDMSADTQAKVLRCLQEQEFEHVGGSRTIRVDVRVIAATNHDLVQAMEKGEFREDLYYRLNVVTLCLPPLRDRKEDIPELAADLLRRFSRELKKPIQGLTGEVQRAFAAYSWPGNIRELSNVIERAVALSETDEVTLGDLPAAIARPGTAPQTDRSTSAVFTLPEPLTYQDAIEVAKKEALRVALAATQNNQSRAAELLGIERSYLSRLMKQYGMR